MPKLMNNSIIDYRIKCNKFSFFRVGNYTKFHEKIKWMCKKCGYSWFASPGNVLHKRNPTGCPQCSQKRKFSIEEVTSILHDKHFKVKDRKEYKNVRSSLTLKCLKCGHTSKNNFSNINIKNQKCPKCLNLTTLSNEEVDLFLNNQDIIRCEDIKLMSTKIKWKCKKCNNEWFTTPRSIVRRKSGCPKCHLISTSNKEAAWLKQNNIKRKFIHFKINIGKKWIIVDGYDPRTNTVYEFYGDFWHGNPKKYRQNDTNHVTKTTFKHLYDKTIKREQLIKNLGYKLITIWESEYAY